VSDSDIQDLFSEFGKLITCKLHFDRNGNSLGTAVVKFRRQYAAMKVIKLYNNAKLDGKPMKIEIMISTTDDLEPAGYINERF